MRLAITVVMMFAAQAAQAQYKCTGADGKVAFQQTPCDDRQRQEAIRLRDGLQPTAPRMRAPAADASLPATTQPRPTDSPYTRLNEMLVRERRTTELEREIQATEGEGIGHDQFGRPGEPGVGVDQEDRPARCFGTSGDVDPAQ